MKDPAQQPFDVAVIGAGAAGLMSAIQSARNSSRVLLLDRRAKFGAKILISGGTRCNITNQSVIAEDFHSEKPHCVRHVLSAFSSTDALSFFEELGLSLIKEADGKYFPSTHSGTTVLNALTAEIHRLGIELHTRDKVVTLERDSGSFRIKTEGPCFYARTVILATGGLSYAATGSDGTGLEIARSLGHSLIETTPALTPLKTADPQLQTLSGIALPARLVLRREKKTLAECCGSLLFTHQGISGPAALDISRHWIRNGGDLFANFTPSVTREAWSRLLLESRTASPRLTLKKLLEKHLPSRLAIVLLEKSTTPANRKTSELKKVEEQSLLTHLKRCPLPITESFGYDKAEVTAGGIDWREVDSKTLGSRKVPGLFFAGEILDVDGRIGGFNFQWAWSSGVVAARGASSFPSAVEG